MNKAIQQHENSVSYCLEAKWKLPERNRYREQRTRRKVQLDTHNSRSSSSSTSEHGSISEKTLAVGSEMWPRRVG